MNHLPQQVRDAAKRSDELLAERNKPAEPAPEPTPEPKPQLTPVADEWKPKYDTLKGKYDAEVPRLQAELRAERETSAQLRQRVAELEADPKPVKQDAPTDGDVSDIPAELVEMLGEDTAKAVAKIIQTKVQPIVDKADAATKAIEQSSAQDNQARFLAALAGKVPNWGQINAMPEWIAWLKEYDEFSGKQRQELLNAASSDGNVDRVASFFHAFTKTTGAADTVKDDPEPDPRESLVVPDQSGRAAAPATSKKVWTRKEINEFYANVAKGRISQERAMELGKDIEAASLEGRIR